ncbi:hypothetical protein QF015_004098 [Paenarthrobacter sp. TE4293]
MAQHNTAPSAQKQAEADLTDFLVRLQDLLVGNADMREFLEDFACIPQPN